MFLIFFSETKNLVELLFIAHKTKKQLNIAFFLTFLKKNIYSHFFKVGEVSRSGLSNIGNLWGQQKSIRSQYEPCEDSTLNCQEFNG